MPTEGVMLWMSRAVTPLRMAGAGLVPSVSCSLTSQGISRAAAAEDEWVDIFHQLPKTLEESL